MTGTSSTKDEPPLGSSRARLVLSYIAVVTAVCTTMLDSMAANMVLPVITTEWDIAPETSAWVVSLYQLVLVSCLLPAASIADRIGIKKVYIFGLSLFIVMASCATLAPNVETLIAVRGLQGAGTACLMSVNLALIRAIVPARWLGTALGINLTVSAIGATLGPAVAGLLISFVSWQYVFAIGVPTGILALAINSFTLRSIPGRPTPLDQKAILLSVLALGSLLAGINGVTQHWPLTVVVVLLACGCVAGGFLVIRSGKSERPLLPVDLFVRPAFSLTLSITMLSFLSQMIVFVTLPFYLQVELGIVAHDAGLIFSAWPIALACIAGVTGLLTDKLSPETICTFGLCILFGGVAMLALLGPEPGYLNIVLALVLCGIGFGLYQVPNNSILLSSVPATRSGQTGSMLAMARLLGQATGVALGTLGLTASLGAAAFWIAAAFILVSLTISIVRLRITTTARPPAQ